LAKVSSEKFIHLTTTGRRSGKSHTVELWFAFKDGNVYLSHEGEETDWMKNIGKTPQVSFETGGSKFSGQARYVQDAIDEAWTAKLALYEKYYGKGTREVIEDWFSLSKLIVIEELKVAVH
jgi:deazaflavin-dependent oxidoreductase (nitroreductase family)